MKRIFAAFLTMLLLLSGGGGMLSGSWSHAGKFNVIPELDVPYVPTPTNVVNAMLRVAEVSRDDFVYDLGCGDGRIVIAAARDHGARGIGVDIDPERIRESRQNAARAGVADKVEFMVGDLFQLDLSEATVVTLYLLPSINLQLRPKLFRELRPGSRVVSHSFDMDEWRPDEAFQVNFRWVYFWTIPANVAGVWEWTGATSSDRFVLELNQKFQEATGFLTMDLTRTAIRDVKIEGDNLSFVIDRVPGGGEGTTRFEGRIRGNSIEGTMKSADRTWEWRAARDPESSTPLYEETVHL